MAAVSKTMRKIICHHCPNRRWEHDLRRCPIQHCRKPMCPLCVAVVDNYCADCRHEGKTNYCICQLNRTDAQCGFCPSCYQAVCRAHAWVAVCPHDDGKDKHRSFWNTVCTNCRHHERSICRICTDQAYLLRDELNVSCHCKPEDKDKPCATQKTAGLITYHRAFEGHTERAESPQPGKKRSASAAALPEAERVLDFTLSLDDVMAPPSNQRAQAK